MSDEGLSPGCRLPESQQSQLELGLGFSWIATDKRSGLHAHRCDGKRYVLRSDEKLTAFLELESAIRAVSDYKPALQTVLINH